MSSLEPSITAVDLDNKDNMLEHLEKVDETVSEQKGDLPSYKLWQSTSSSHFLCCV